MEPTGLYRADGKCSDGCSILPWKTGKVMVWDATCLDTFVLSHVSAAAREAGAVAAQAEHLKITKFPHLEASHHFIPFAVETSGMLGQAAHALDLVNDIGRRLHRMTGEPRCKEYLLQRLFIAIK